MSIYGHRRGSIFWALTLIAVGGIFLYHNFNPNLHPWEILARYWPVMIIFWGISKLLDYVAARQHPDTAPPPLFTGTEVLLLIMILVLGTLISRIVLRPWQQWPQALGFDVGDDDFARMFYNSYTYDQAVSHPAGTTPHLVLVNRRGDVEVHGADLNTYEAAVKETVWAPNETEARQLSQQIKLQFVDQAGRTELHTNLDSLPNNGRNVRLDIVLRVPFRTQTDITTERGDLLADSLRADQVFTSKHGDIHVADTEGFVRISKSGGLTAARGIKGNVEIEGRGDDIDIADVTGLVNVNGEFGGDVQFHNVSQTVHYLSSRTDLTAQKLSGRLDMQMGSIEGEGIDGPFEVATKQKDINLQNFHQSVKITNSNGNIDLTTSVVPTHDINVDLKKGELELSLPANSGFKIEAVSHHGEVESDFQGSGLKIDKEGENPSITGSYGKGGPAIHLSTAFGAVRLLHSGSSASAPAKPAKPEAPAPADDSGT
jgi:LiaI-LiaF-like transmembrane region/Toastrack DUF4097